MCLGNKSVEINNKIEGRNKITLQWQRLTAKKVGTERRTK